MKGANSNKSFRSKRTVRVDDIRVHRNSQEHSPHPSQSVQNDGNNPLVTIFNRPSESEIPNTSNNHSWNHKKETEFRFVDTAVAFRHETSNVIAKRTADNIGNHSENPGRETD